MSGMLKLIALVAICILAAATALAYFFPTGMAISQAFAQCPNGNSCIDAKLFAGFGTLVILQSVCLVVLAIGFIKNRAKNDGEVR